MYVTNKERIVMTMKQRYYDVVIVGTGASGLFTALSLPSHIRVLMITKDAIDHSDSYLAQGGICVLKSPDDFDSYFEDTMRAGHYENNKEAVKIMIESSPEIIEDLIGFGVAFERDENGNLLYTREGAHSNYRILYHEDVTGKEITSTLIQQVIHRPNITVFDYTTMIDLIVKENTCYGIIVEKEDGSKEAMIAKSIVLATGGIGGLFENSTNFPHITGDSFSLALKHQIELENLHYIQIHPTTLYSKKKGRRFLISESVRGEGAILLNEDHERFTDELKPRDVVTSAIKAEMEKFGTDHVYLTLPSMTKEEAKRQCNQYVEVTNVEFNGTNIDYANQKTYDDWRLPTKAEIEIIDRFQKTENSAVSDILTGRYYWTATDAYKANDEEPSGSSQVSTPDNARIRCVRDVKPEETGN